MFQRQYSRAMKALGPLITALETKLAAVYAPVPPIAVATSREALFGPVGRGYFASKIMTARQLQYWHLRCSPQVLLFRVLCKEVQK